MYKLRHVSLFIIFFFYVISGDTIFPEESQEMDSTRNNISSLHEGFPSDTSTSEGSLYICECVCVYDMHMHACMCVYACVHISLCKMYLTFLCPHVTVMSVYDLYAFITFSMTNTGKTGNQASSPLPFY